MHFYKWVRNDHNHFGHIFTKGLNVDLVPFNPSGSGKPGGFHYLREDILAFFDFGNILYRVEIPPNAQTYEDPLTEYKFWKSSKIILSNPRPFNLETVIELVIEGANPHVNDEAPLILAANYGYLDLVEFFVSCGADINAQNGSALKYALINHRFHVVEYLINKGAEIRD